MRRALRFMIYSGITAFAAYMVAPALSIDLGRLGEPVRALFTQLSPLAVAAGVVVSALLITYLITSGWGLLLLGSASLLGLLAVAILHPYLMPLLIPLFAIWIACALARRKTVAAA